MRSREKVCSQQVHCLSCPLSVRVTGKDCRELMQEEIKYYMKKRKSKRYKIKERIKCARWIPISSYELFGGDEILWEAHGNPIADYYCSKCHDEAILSCDNEFNLTKYCGNCGTRMINGGVRLPIK